MTEAIQVSSVQVFSAFRAGPRIVFCPDDLTAQAFPADMGKGEFAFGIALGLVLLTVALVVNILFSLLRERGR